MSVSTATPAVTGPVAPGSTLAGTGTLVRFLLRRDRIRLPAWAGGLGLFIVYVSTALPAAIGETEAELATMTGLFREPVGRMFVGPGYGFHAPTFERLVANGYGLYLLVLVALMSILLVVRHTRAEEQTGRAELVRANVVGRHAPLTATMVVAAMTNLAVAATVLAAMVGVGGFGVGGSLLLAAGVVAVGLSFAGVAAVAVQLSEYSRAATGSASAVLGIAFVVRAGGDMAAEGGTTLSWLSPLGWGQQTAPFVLDRWWPLLPLVALALVTTATGFVLSTRRDLAASLVAVRPGPAHAPASLGTPLGLAFRLHRGSLVGWTVALGITGVTYGAYADALLTAVGDLPELFAELFGDQDLVAGYLAYVATFVAYLAAAYAVAAMQGLRGEETTGRSEPVLATPVGRTSWLGVNLGVIAGGALGMLAVAGIATGIGATVVTGEGRYVVDLTLAHLNQVPAVWVVIGVAALLFGLVPRAVGAAWVLVAFGLFAGTFGGLLDLPQTVLNLSPFGHPAELPLEPFAATPMLVLTAVAAVLAAGGLAAYRGRDLDVK